LFFVGSYDSIRLFPWNDPVVTPALDHLYSKAVIDLSAGPVLVELPTVPRDRYFSIHVTDEEHCDAMRRSFPAPTASSSSLLQTNASMNNSRSPR